MATALPSEAPALPQVAGGLSRLEALAILTAERRDQAGDKIFKGALVVAILGLLILLIPDQVDFSFELGKLKFDKIAGQKELLCLVAALTLYRFGIDLSKFAHYGSLYDHSLEVDLEGGSRALVRAVADDEDLQVLYISKEILAWKVFRRVQNTKKLMTFLVVFGSIGAAFVVTTINIAKLFWSPAMHGAAPYILLVVSTLLLALFLVSIFEILLLWPDVNTSATARESKEGADNAANTPP